MAGSVGSYAFSQLFSGRWQVKRGSFIMAVFGTRSEAAGYAQRKHDAEGHNEQ